MRFLVQKDYERRITVDDLNQVFDNGSDVQYTVQQRILDTEPEAQEEISGYLRQRYDVAKIFTDTSIYNNSVVYYGDNRVQYHETAFSATTVYLTGQRVSYNGSIYSSIAGSASHAFNANEWTFLCLDYQLFYALLPKPRFVYGNTYNTGDQVWFNDGTYTCKYNGTTLDPTNTYYWTFNSTYSFTGQLPTNGTYWILGDNRNSLLVQKMVDIVLYQAHATINQRNIPQLRIDRYAAKRDFMQDANSTSAISWLISLSEGKLSADLPELPPSSSELSFRSGNNFNGLIDNTPNMTY